MTDRFKNRETDLDSPGRGDGDLIVPNDIELLSPRPRFVQITGGGTLRAEVEVGKVQNYSAVEVAAMQGIFPVSFVRIHASGTDAGLLIRGYQ